MHLFVVDPKQQSISHMQKAHRSHSAFSVQCGLIHCLFNGFSEGNWSVGSLTDRNERPVPRSGISCQKRGGNAAYKLSRGNGSSGNNDTEHAFINTVPSPLFVISAGFVDA